MTCRSRIEKDQARSGTDAGDRAHLRRMILAEHETNGKQAFRGQAVDDARIVRHPAGHKTGVLRQEVGCHGGGHGEGVVREGRFASEISAHQLVIAAGTRSRRRCPRRVDFDAGFPEQFGAVTSFVLPCPEHLRSSSEYSKSFVLSVEVCKL